MNSADRYHEAMSMQRHSDSLSQAAITAMVVVAGGTPALYKTLGMPAAGAVFLAALPLLRMAMKIYESCEVHAAYALKVAALYEVHGDPDTKPTRNGEVFHGPAHAFFGPERVKYDLAAGVDGTIYRTVRTFYRAVCLLFVVLGASALYVDWYKGGKPAEAPAKTSHAAASKAPPRVAAPVAGKAAPVD